MGPADDTETTGGLSSDVLRQLRRGTLERTVLENIRARNNPLQEPIGPYTGRCQYCESDKYMFDDAAIYGCTLCLSLYSSA